MEGISSPKNPKDTCKVESENVHIENAMFLFLLFFQKLLSLICFIIIPSFFNVIFKNPQLYKPFNL